MTTSNIPHDIHIIWIGDAPPPKKCFNSWIKMNPEWRIHLWDNTHLYNVKWHNQKQIDIFLKRLKTTTSLKEQHLCLSAISDMMRYEILYAVGGFYVDADSHCTRSLENWLFDSDFCAASENEFARPGLIGNSFIASTKKNDLLLNIITKIYNENNIMDDEVWKKTGPGILTTTFLETRPSSSTIWPSHYFFPSHYTGYKYTGSGNIFASHEWGSQKF